MKVNFEQDLLTRLYDCIGDCVYDYRDIKKDSDSGFIRKSDGVYKIDIYARYYGYTENGVFYVNGHGIEGTITVELTEYHDFDNEDENDHFIIAEFEINLNDIFKSIDIK